MKSRFAQKRAIVYAIYKKEQQRQEELIKSKGLWQEFLAFYKAGNYCHWKMALTQFEKKYCK